MVDVKVVGDVEVVEVICLGWKPGGMKVGHFICDI